ncbi:MAG: NADH-quinone oxidoreductase subunit NuoG [Rhodospirillales bacterium]|nr:NADH-quinone oxidoreductase subunit NuoG [Rhodospirillales bacterium]
MPKLTIDGREIEVAPGLTVIQACEQAGIEIPRFCYHERLSIAGNCRMCLVEMEKAPKLVASCAMPVGDGMVIHTNSEKVIKARKGVMEFLLINHPLDCPICDQGGECDLQDQAMTFGIDKGRFDEGKRAVDEKDFGPLIRGTMTRCIHCTRCIRFASQVAGTPDLGGIGRGEHMEVTTYVGNAIASELSGNLIDLCPVGALTSRPYAFRARPWELRHVESVDVFDAVGSNIRVDCRGPEIMRVLPRLNEEVNEEWISDKSRFAIDGLRAQRLDRPYVRRDGSLVPASWDEAFAAIADRLKGMDGSKIAAIAGDMADCESMYALKSLLKNLGSGNLDCRQDGASIEVGKRAGYLFNSTIAGIDEADAILLIGTNPRWEAPVINARIRERYLRGGLSVGVVGPQLDLTYRYDYLGDGPSALSALADGKDGFAKVLRKAERPMLIVGAGALARSDGAAVIALAGQIANKLGMIKDGWNGFNVLHTAASRVGGMETGFVPANNGRDIDGILDGASKGEVEAIYLLGADEIDMARLGKAFVIYQGHHGDAGAARADVILPGAAYTEKQGTWVNTEGRVQRGELASFPPGEAKADWTIVRALSGVLDKVLPFDSIEGLRAAMASENPVFATVDTITPADWCAVGQEGKLDDAPFVSPIANFYMTDPISRCSPTMAACTEVFIRGAQERTGTDG